jgi:hypothetical protein
LEEFDRESGRVLSRVRLSEGLRLVSFYEDHLGVFWITYITSKSGSGLAVLDRSTNSLIPYSIYDRKSGKELPAGFMAATEDNSQTLWLATRTGLKSCGATDGRPQLFALAFTIAQITLGVKPCPQNSACFVDRPQQRTCVDAGTNGPTVDCLVYPLRNGDRPDVATFSSQVSDDPMAFPKLEIFQP